MTVSSPRHPRRSLFTRVAAAALVAALSMSLSGCVTWFMPAKASTTSTPVPQNVDPSLKPFYSQVLTWTACADGMQCTTMRAPLNWSKPGAGEVSLALVRHPATGKRLGSLLVNPGGPGASGVNFVKTALSYATDKTLQTHYDVVGFDPRGVGNSSAVKCYKPAQMDQYLYSITPGQRGSDAWIAEQAQASAAFGLACKQNTGPLLDEVDTVSAARDLDLMRAVLGDTKLNYLGYSYGTYLGSTYASLYPKNVGRMVLDGAIDPAASNFEVTKIQSEGFESALRAYMKNCLAGKKCPFTGTVENGMQTVGQLLKAVDASPIRNSDGRELGANTLLTAIIYPLYDANSWSYLSEMFTNLMQGSPAAAFALADAYNGRNSDGTYTDNSTEAFMAINCLDYTYNADPTVMRAQAAELARVAPVIGPYMGYGDIGCAEWPYQSTRDRGPIHAKGAAPILVVGTTNDPATPYVWAQNLARELQSGHLVTYTGEGHTAYNKSNSCVNNAVDTYLVSGTVPTSDPRC